MWTRDRHDVMKSTRDYKTTQCYESNAIARASRKVILCNTLDGRMIFQFNNSFNSEDKTYIQSPQIALKIFVIYE